MPSVTQGERIENKIITLGVKYQTDFAEGSLFSLLMSHITCLPCIRTALSALWLLNVGLAFTIFTFVKEMNEDLSVS